MTHKEAGFTLIEALFAMMIVAILICVAQSLYMGAVASAKIGEARALLYETLTTAMRHATVTRTPVVLCTSSDLTSCSGSTDWSGGWIAFADVDRDRAPGPGDTMLRRQSALWRGIGVTGTSGRTRLVFRAGGGNPGSNTTFTFCDRRSRATPVSVMLANSGRLRHGDPAVVATDACRAGSG